MPLVSQNFSILTDPDDAEDHKIVPKIAVPGPNMNPELQRLLASLNNASQKNTQNNTLNLANDGLDTRALISSAVTDHNASTQNFVKQGVESQDSPFNTSNATSHRANAQLPLANLKSVEDRSRSITPSTQTVPDASTITTWAAAIKHIAKHIINDEKATVRIKHLMKQQQQHEEQWWTQREAIVAKHKGREGSNNKVADILKELGGLAVPIAKVDEAADRNELETFDRKVYKSLVQMSADFDSQLRRLGVPFYAIKHDLILLGNESGEVPTKGKLDKGELRDLQKRMLQYLEDLLMDD